MTQSRRFYRNPDRRSIRRPGAVRSQALLTMDPGRSLIRRPGAVRSQTLLIMDPDPVPLTIRLPSDLLGPDQNHLPASVLTGRIDCNVAFIGTDARMQVAPCLIIEARIRIQMHQLLTGAGLQIIRE